MPMPSLPAPVALAALVPHPPILLPQIGQGREREAAATLAAYAHLRACLKNSGAQRILLIATHGIVTLHRFHLLAGPLKTSLARFDAPQISIDLPTDQPFNDLLLETARQRGIPLSPTPFWEESDHSACVPLTLLDAQSLQLPLAVVGISFLPAAAHLELGRAIADAIHRDGTPTAVIASGDGAHTLAQNSPSGFHPRARAFQDQFDRALAELDSNTLLDLDENLRQAVDESVVSPASVLLGITESRPARAKILSAEAPWGVAYTAAQITPDGPA